MSLEVVSPIYYVTPGGLPEPARLVALVREVLRARVGVVQYRAKEATTQRMYEDTRALLAVTRLARVPLIVNDRVDVALAAGADGVHVGQTDLPVAVARRLMGPYAVLGVTVDTVEQARQAERDGASYVAVGPVFPSPTKPECPAIGPASVAAMRGAVQIPVCAIGGITAENLAALADAAPDLVAVISAINEAPNPGMAARELVAAAHALWPRSRPGV